MNKPEKAARERVLRFALSPHCTVEDCFDIKAVLKQLTACEAELAEARRKMRMIVSHATGGHSSDIERSTNDICVAISANRSLIYEDGKQRGALKAEADRDRLISLVNSVVSDLESAERETNWCGGDPYGESASQRYREALAAIQEGK